MLILLTFYLLEMTEDRSKRRDFFSVIFTVDKKPCTILHSFLHFSRAKDAISHEKCRKECNIKIILVQGFFPLKIKITLFSDGFCLRHRPHVSGNL